MANTKATAISAPRVPASAQASLAAAPAMEAAPKDTTRARTTQLAVLSECRLAVLESNWSNNGSFQNMKSGAICRCFLGLVHQPRSEMMSKGSLRPPRGPCLNTSVWWQQLDFITRSTTVWRSASLSMSWHLSPALPLPFPSSATDKKLSSSIVQQSPFFHELTPVRCTPHERMPASEGLVFYGSSCMQ